MQKCYSKIKLSEGMFSISLSQAKRLWERLYKYAYEFTCTPLKGYEHMDAQEKAHVTKDSMYTLVGIEKLLWYIATAGTAASQAMINEFCSIAAYDKYGARMDQMVEECRRNLAAKNDRIDEAYQSYEYTKPRTDMSNENVDRHLWDYNSEYLDILSGEVDKNAAMDLLRQKYLLEKMHIKVQLPEEIKEKYEIIPGEEPEMHIERPDGRSDVISWEVGKWNIECR